MWIFFNRYLLKMERYNLKAKGSFWSHKELDYDQKSIRIQVAVFWILFFISLLLYGNLPHSFLHANFLCFSVPGWKMAILQNFSDQACNGEWLVFLRFNSKYSGGCAISDRFVGTKNGCMPTFQEKPWGRNQTQAELPHTVFQQPATDGLTEVPGSLRKGSEAEGRVTELPTALRTEVREALGW